MILTTWNVNSIRARLDHVLRYLAKWSPGVVCLQELKVEEGDFPFEPFRERGYEAGVSVQKGYNGVAVIARDGIRNVAAGFPHLAPDHVLNAQRRVVAATVSGVRVISVYVPNGESVGSEKFAYKLEFLRALRKYLDAESSHDRMLCLAGDFNVAPEAIDVYDPVAWDGQVLFSESERTELEGLRALGLVDCLRKLHPEGGLYSWWDYRGGAFSKGMGLRIDHVWATRPLAERCVSCEIDVSPRKWKKPSDHAPVRAGFAL